ncbi:MAG: ABC transporter ATP-binding protein [Xenococcus sp. MO_188.B8]|nr:ABC transporter ATP-binding protein [Xenococcus sp. MO_188.B8]
MLSSQIREPNNPQYVAKEIEQFIEDNQLDLATKKLMDFATDFGRYRNRRSEALDIRRSYNQWREENRLYKGSQKVREDLTCLVQRMVDFIDQILNENPRFSQKKIIDIQDEQKNNINYENNTSQINPQPSTIDRGSEISSTSDHQETINDQMESVHQSQEDSDKDSSRDSWQKKRERFRESQQDEPIAPVVQDPDLTSDYFNTVFLGQNIKKKYRGKSTDFTLFVDQLRLNYGEITSLVGENGNGKTTLLRIVAGQLKESSGKIEYPALSRKRKPKNRDFISIKQQIAYIPQELPKWSGLLIDNLHFSAAIHGITGEDNEFEVDFIISRLGLDKYRNSIWSEISGGFKMRFALAKALLWNPKILVLDEPLANLDVNTQMLFLEDLRDIADSTENRKAIILSSQHLHEVESITDNIIFISNGSASYNGSLQNFGEDRTANSFEFVCNLSKNELMNVLEEIDYSKIDIVIHYHYIITTSRSVTSGILFTLFSEKGIDVSFFRDISKSTRRLFSDQASK